MKVVHVLKRIETIDQDIKELRKIEKSLQRNKSFTQPIYISIEKQINILLGERIKLFELKIANPPENMVVGLEDEEMTPSDEQLLAKPKKKNRKTASSKTKTTSKTEKEEHDDFDDDEFSMLTQDQIDKKISSLEKEEYNTKSTHSAGNDSNSEANDDNVKLLDIALEKGTLKKEEADKDKKKVRFFKDNFPGGEY